MPISKSDVVKLNSMEENRLHDMEEVIDERLRKESIARITVSIHASDIWDPTEKELAELTKRYKALGWKVSVETTQMEGTYISFS